MVGYDSDGPHTPRAGQPRIDYASRRKPALILAAVLAGVGVVAAVAGLLVVFVFDDDRSRRDPADTAVAYLAAWQQDDVDEMVVLVDDPPASFADEHETFRQSLSVEAAEHELLDVETEGDDAIAHFSSTLTLSGLGDWTYEGRLRLRAVGEDGAWLVDWSPAALHPRQTDEQRLTMTSAWPERGAITGSDGQPLIAPQPAQLVGIHPELMDDIDERDEIKDALEEHLGVDPDDVDAALDAPGVQPDHLIPVITIPEARYEEVRDDIHPVPGLVFRDRSLRMGPTEDFARHIIGRTGEVTAELLDELDGPYRPGDVVGLTGLERRFERELAGTPSGEILLVARDDADTSPDDELVDTVDGIEPVDIETTLDLTVQLAIEQALDDVEDPVGVVVVDREGNIRGAASRPLGEFNRALEGTYPPGSTFKLVTTEALLAAGTTPETTVDCDETIDAGGRVFTNFEDADLGTVPFSTAFAQSCNTAFIAAAGQLDGADLVAAAERFGFNTTYDLGFPAAGGEFPLPADATEHAAAGIGQGRVVTSPLHMATVTAAVMDGTWHPPTLLARDLDDSQDGLRDESDDDESNDGDDGEGDGDGEPPEPRDLTPGSAETIQNLMELVVTEGSGDAAAVDGVRILGKTGTAEFDAGDPPPTHAWFVGIRGDLALALVIHDGGVGGRDAAPVAGDILAVLPD